MIENEFSKRPHAAGAFSLYLKPRAKQTLRKTNNKIFRTKQKKTQKYKKNCRPIRRNQPSPGIALREASPESNALRAIAFYARTRQR